MSALPEMRAERMFNFAERMSSAQHPEGESSPRIDLTDEGPALVYHGGTFLIDEDAGGEVTEEVPLPGLVVNRGGLVAMRVAAERARAEAIAAGDENRAWCLINLVEGLAWAIESIDALNGGGADAAALAR